MAILSFAPNFAMQREPMQLVLRSTFIDVEATFDGAPWAKSLSEPATLNSQTGPTELKEERMYVRSLAERACCLLKSTVYTPLKLTEESKPTIIKKRRKPVGPCRDLFSSEHSTVASWGDITEVTEITDFQSAIADGSCQLKEVWRNAKVGDFTNLNEGDSCLNLGSRGHPHLCERVCTFAAAGRCSGGISCSFCHIPHTTKQVHLDKRNRKLVKGMPYAARAALILPIMEQKARDHDFGPACDELLSLLVEKMYTFRGSAPNLRDHRDSDGGKGPCRKALVRVIAAMSFADVLRHLMGGLSSQEAPNQEDIHILMGAMRSYVETKRSKS
eukprot:CAMPEP_0170620976 /NCGR_PEP_ID=MMETSP0224-20130122/28353_1 /TAXON_ID=285029 /ORGANISM="Togula jolla, Strain CCCM 725" /LENGTH=329 /DNA_ID=CAMNT_0010947201 /DNA_START=27 /DNA_END=1016 /DNA_ORIENTATION=-